jgi:ParB family chromosome partitioning protein
MATTTRTRPARRTVPVKASKPDTTPELSVPVDHPTIASADHIVCTDMDGDERAIAQPVGDFAMLSVGELLAHPDNLREEARPNAGLVANLKTDGIAGLLQPIIVTAHPDSGGYLIVDGHERVLSVREAGHARPDLTHIPALIRPDLAGRAEQIIAMLRTGVHRRQLTTVEQARGVQQLTLSGLSKDRVAKQTGYKRRQVEDALRVADMDTVTATKVTMYGLDLHQAAVVHDFADDNDAVARLLKAAENGPIAFDKANARERDERREARKRQARIKELTDAGITVLTGDTLYDHHPERRPLHDLMHDGQPLTQDDHTDCPGHAIAVERIFDGFRETPYCTNWRRYKHTDRYGGSGAVTGSMTERQKAERRTVIANNKAMKAANEVRRKWLATLLARKSVKGAARYVAETMVSRPYFLSRWTQKDAPLLDHLLGTATNRNDLAVVPPSANDSRCVVYALAAIAAAHESEITHETWRHNDANTARWFAFLRTLGYHLDPVEQMVVDKIHGTAPDDGECNTDAQADPMASADHDTDAGSDSPTEDPHQDRAEPSRPRTGPTGDTAQPANAGPDYLAEPVPDDATQRAAAYASA